MLVTKTTDEIVNNIDLGSHSAALMLLTKLGPYWHLLDVNIGHQRFKHVTNTFRHQQWCSRINYLNVFELRSQLRHYTRLELVAGPYVLFYLSLDVGHAILSAAFSKNSKMSYTNVQNARRKFFIRAIFNW